MANRLDSSFRELRMDRESVDLHDAFEKRNRVSSRPSLHFANRELQFCAEFSSCDVHLRKGRVLSAGDFKWCGWSYCISWHCNSKLGEHLQDFALRGLHEFFNRSDFRFIKISAGSRD